MFWRLSPKIWDYLKSNGTDNVWKLITEDLGLSERYQDWLNGASDSSCPGGIIAVQVQPPYASDL